MASLVMRGTSFSVKYTYIDDQGKEVQHWEAYKTKLEASQRKALIDSLQERKDTEKIRELALEYKINKADLNFRKKTNRSATPDSAGLRKDENLTKSFAEFAAIWAPIHARKNQLEPMSYDSLIRNIETHINPYFGKKPMSTITAQDIDEFMDYLSQKKCMGSKSYNKVPDEIPALSSGSIKKIYDVLNSALPMAKEWGYIREIPNTKAPTVKYKKRKYWTSQQIMEAISTIQDQVLRLAIHLAFVGSFRPGETVAVSITAINFTEKSLIIGQTLQRVSDEAIKKISSQDIIRVFPKQHDYAKSSLILKTTKTDEERKVFLTDPLIDEIQKMIKRIDECKIFFGPEYHDYGFLFCQPNGDPIEPTLMVKRFRNWQKEIGISDTIDMQALRKSGQMHKIRISQHDYQTVADFGGHSPEVLMSRYDEALEHEKKQLANLMQEDLYGTPGKKEDATSARDTDMIKLLEAAKSNPELVPLILKALGK